MASIPPPAPLDRFAPPWGCRLVRSLIWWPALSMITVGATSFNPTAVIMVVGIVLVGTSLLLSGVLGLLERSGGNAGQDDAG